MGRVGGGGREGEGGKKRGGGGQSKYPEKTSDSHCETRYQRIEVKTDHSLGGGTSC